MKIKKEHVNSAIMGFWKMGATVREIYISFGFDFNLSVEQIQRVIEKYKTKSAATNCTKK